MTRNEIKAKIRAIIASELNLKVPEVLDDEGRLFEDLGIDSLMIMQIVVYIEEQFDVTIPDESLDPNVLGTVGELVGFVENLLEENAG